MRGLTGCIIHAAFGRLTMIYIPLRIYSKLKQQMTDWPMDACMPGQP